MRKKWLKPKLFFGSEKRFFVSQSIFSFIYTNFERVLPPFGFLNAKTRF